MITGYQERQFLVYLGFYLFLIVVGYQYVRAQKPYWGGLIGLIAIAAIVILYTIRKLFSPNLLSLLHFCPRRDCCCVSTI